MQDIAKILELCTFALKSEHNVYLVPNIPVCI